MASQSKYIQQEHGSGAWANPTEMDGPPDNVCGSLNNDGAYSEFDFTGDLFTLPVGAVVDGIEVIVDMAAGDSDDDVGIQLEDTITWVAEKITDNTAGTACANSVAAPTLGGPTDVWGGTWTRAHINSTSFRVRVLHEKNGKQDTVYCDSVQVIVYYTIAALGQPYKARVQGIEGMKSWVI